MASFRRFLLRLNNLLHPQLAEAALSREIESHLTLIEDDCRRRGMSPDDARREAKRRLGGIQQTRELHRRARAFPWLDDARQDLRYAVRTLRLRPLFALTAALSLAIGIAADTTVFTVANALLFSAPAGVAEPGRLVDIISNRAAGGLPFESNQLSYPNYLDLRQRATTFEDMYAYEFMAMPISMGGGERLFKHAVTSNYFTVLGIRPAIGRMFRADDNEERTGARIAVLSHKFWVRRFHADQAIVGQTLPLNGDPFTVVGVAAEGFEGTTIVVPDVWLPVAADSVGKPMSNRGALGAWALVSGRLKPGVSLGEANAEIDTIGRVLVSDYPDENRGISLSVRRASMLYGQLARLAGRMITLLLGFVSLVLAIACANLAGVLLARGAARRREVAVRSAIGAGRLRLVRQFLTETVVLFVAGGVIGIALSRLLTTIIASLLPALPVPFSVSLPLDGRVLAFSIGLSLAAAVLCGLAPAIHASITDVMSALKEDAQGRPGRLRLRSAFVVGQIALSIVLVAGAGLFMRGFQKAASIDPGFDSHGVELAAVDLSIAGYTRDTAPAFGRDVLERLRALPDVESAAVAAGVPIADGPMRLGRFAIPGSAPSQNGDGGFDVRGNIVAPGYFATMGIPLVAGRDCAAADTNDRQLVVILSETAARLISPGESPVGRVVQPAASAGSLDGMRSVLIIGVVRDVKMSLGEVNPRPFAYVPWQQHHHLYMTLVARSRHGQRLARELRALVASMNPRLPILTSRTLDEAIDANLLPYRAAASVAGGLGIVGLVLAAIGIYGVTAYTVTRRTREIGIRIAMGATRSDIVRLVLRQGVGLTGAGAVIGLGLASLAGLLAKRVFFGLPQLDWPTFAGSALMLTVVALVACYLPARRATRIDPLTALRCE